MTTRPIGPGNSSNPPLSSSALYETYRLGYSAETQKLKPLSGPVGENIKQMEQCESKIAQLPIPLDCSSPTVLENVAKQTQPSAEKIESDTEGVKEFVSGNLTLYTAFISSITGAQRTI